MKHFLFLIILVFFSSCNQTKDSQNPQISSLVNRGKSVYQVNCTACHATDPSKDGPVGPAVAGSSEELLRKRIMNAAYPEGYSPKRESHVMLPLPHLEKEIDALAAYLQSL